MARQSSPQLGGQIQLIRKLTPSATVSYLQGPSFKNKTQNLISRIHARGQHSGSASSRRRRNSTWRLFTEREVDWRTRGGLPRPNLAQKLFRPVILPSDFYKTVIIGTQWRSSAVKKKERHAAKHVKDLSPSQTIPDCTKIQFRRVKTSFKNVRVPNWTAIHSTLSIRTSAQPVMAYIKVKMFPNNSTLLFHATLLYFKKKLKQVLAVISGE